NHAPALRQLANGLNLACREGQAVEILTALAAADPEWGLRLDLANAQFNAGRFVESERILESLLAEVPQGHPAYEAAHYNLHWHWLKRRKFAQGMQAFYAPQRSRSTKRPEFLI